MAKTEIEKLFIPHLGKGEELLWIGDNRMPFGSSKLRKQDIPMLLVWSLVLLLFFPLGLIYGKTIYGCLIVCPGLIGIGIFTAYRSSLSKNGGDKSLNPSAYYAISNQRILSLENNTLQDFRLMLVADAIVDKPKNGLSTIKIYNNSNPNGELPTPIFQLKGIAEEAAQKAYETLRQAREEALEDRAREMGID